MQAVIGPPAPAATAMSLRTCAAMIATAPDSAVAAANRWYIARGGVDARLCAGQAHAASANWASAAVAFTQAADDATRANDPRAAHLYVQAGNAWLAAGEPIQARAGFDTALSLTMSDELRGETLIDRTRAHVETGNLRAARADLDRGVRLVPADPFGWYASASLAARMGDLVRARADIAHASGLAPADPGIRTLAASLLAASLAAPTSGSPASR